MKTLKLSKDLSFPIDAITQTFLIVGKRGSGKSNTAARLVEQFHAAKLPFVVLDPVDTWYGIRSSRDGSGPGLENVYVFGGRKQDVQLEASAGALIAEVLCEHRISMVLSVKHLSGRERSGFMVDFAKTLFQKWAGGPLHLVLEEAHELAPQSIPKNERAEEMLGAFKRLWKLGRASGIGGSAVTQRPASLSKDITTQSEILIAHRTIGPQDVKAVGEWVKYRGEHEQILGDLPTLPTGQAFVWSPEFPSDKPLGLKRATILLRDTYDSASTPKVGEQRVEPKELADVDLERLRTKMAKTIERAKADDPRELKKQLAEANQMLARQAKSIGDLQARPASQSSEKSPTKKEEARAGKIAALQQQLARHRRALEEAMKILVKVKAVDFSARGGEALEQAVTQAVKQVTACIEKKVNALRERVDGIQAAAVSAEAAITKLLDEKIELSVVVQKHAPFTVQQTAKPVTRPPRQSPNGAGSDNVLTPAKQKILNGLAFVEGIGVREADKTQLALIVGVSPTSGAYFNNLGALRTAGLISYPSGGTVALTDEGHAIAVVENVPTTTGELHEAIRSKLPPAKWKILEALIAAYPNAVPKEALAESIGVSPTSGAYFNNLGSLRSLGLLDYPRPSEAIAKPVLFLEG